MFYQEILPIFWFVSHVDSLLTIADRHCRTLAATFKKAESANSLPFAWNGCLFMWGVYFCMGAYKRDVVAEIKMGIYIDGVLILCGCLLSRFYGMDIEYIRHSIYTASCLNPTWNIHVPCTRTDEMLKQTWSKAHMKFCTIRSSVDFRV